MTSTILFPSRDVRDTVMKAGLEHSAPVLYDALDKVLAEMTKTQ
jgi:hypothetical protein